MYVRPSLKTQDPWGGFELLEVPQVMSPGPASVPCRAGAELEARGARVQSMDAVAFRVD